MFDIDNWPWPWCDLADRCILLFSITVVSFIKMYQTIIQLLTLKVFDLDSWPWPWAWPCRKISLFFIHHCAKFHRKVLIHSLFIWINSLTLTFDIDLKNNLVIRCVSSLSIILLSLIEKYKSILFLWIFTYLEWHKPPWPWPLGYENKISMRLLPILFIKYSYWFSEKSNSSWFYSNF
jgi:hypothetical protein